MNRRDVAGWLLPLAVLIATVPVALGRVFGIAVEPQQSALASFVAAIAGLALLSIFREPREPAAPEPKAPAPRHGRVHQPDSARVG